MDKIFGYIFGSLDRTEDSLKSMRRQFKTQNKINKCLSVSLVACVIGAAIIGKQHKTLESKMDILERKVKELESAKEE